jgi:hypothetical protein
MREDQAHPKLFEAFVPWVVEAVEAHSAGGISWHEDLIAKRMDVPETAPSR